MNSNTGNLSATVTPTSAISNDTLLGKPTPLQVWGIGLLLVTIINACAFLGVIFLPLMKRRLYKFVLAFMVALAVGTLAGSALLVLIPEALNLTENVSKEYVWKCTAMLAGLYGFFLIERFLKHFIEFNSCRAPPENDFVVCPSMNLHREAPENDPISEEMRTPPSWHQHSLCHHNRNVGHDNDEKGKRAFSYSKEDFNTDGVASEQESSSQSQQSHPVAAGHTCNFFEQPMYPNSSQQHEMASKKSPSNKSNHTTNHHSHHPHGAGDTASQEISHNQSAVQQSSSKRIAPVAWMIILGDGVHNFVDGLSLGAAFAKNTRTGISLSVAVICEELPHELGDFAVLLNSGMSMKKALCANFISACTCYLGFAVGAALGEAFDNTSWILALAGGMFLYISLVDMMPEVIRMYEMDEAAHLGRSTVFILQNMGLIVGYGCILIMTLFSGYLHF